MIVSRLFYYLSSIPTLLVGVRNWPRMVVAFLGIAAPKPFVIRLRTGNRFLVRTPMDIWIIKETCLDRQYERASVEIEDGWTIIDIGAGLGDFAIYAAQKCPHGTVYAYEPFPVSFSLLQENLLLNRIRNVMVFPCAISSHTGSIDLYNVSGEAVQQSTAFQPNRSHDSIRVPSITLDRVFVELQLTKCDYLKMDCEGAEYEILFSAGESTLQRIKYICLEYHDGVTEFSHRDLYLFLEKQGFQVRLVSNPAWPHLGFLYAANPALIAEKK